MVSRERFTLLVAHSFTISSVREVRVLPLYIRLSLCLSAVNYSPGHSNLMCRNPTSVFLTFRWVSFISFSRVRLDTRQTPEVATRAGADIEQRLILMEAAVRVLPALDPASGSAMLMGLLSPLMHVLAQGLQSPTPDENMVRGYINARRRWCL